MPLQAPYPVCPLVPDRKNAISSERKPLYPTPNRRNSWVKLHQRPNEYSFDEAMLLCQESSNTWLAWVPDHGEIRLSSSDFYS